MLTTIDWVAVFALVVAIVSLFISVRFNRKTLNLTEKHNKKTVEPFLADHFNNMSEDPDPSKKVQTYTIKNCGPGPAIITLMRFTYKNEELTDLQAFYEEHTKSINCFSRLRITKIGSSHILSSNDNMELFNFSCPSDYHLKRILEINKSVGVHIVYSSIYGNEKVFHRDAIYYDKEFVDLKVQASTVK
jgi:hypothetical protein